MKKIIPAIAAVSVLMIGFQNCSQQSEKMGNSALNLPPSSKIENPKLSQAESLDILTRNNQTVTLNLRNGELLQVVDEMSAKKCLSESMLGQVQDVLNNSNLCEFQDPEPDMACAQVYSAPYADIHWIDKHIKVGEAVSSCHKDVDLCGQDGKILRGLLNDIISRWDEWSCDFKVVSK